MEMKKLIQAILLIILASFLTESIASSDHNVKVEIEDAGETNEKWHSSRSTGPIQFKYFEAIVRDSTGKQYALSASLAGNIYMYEAHAWLVDADKWYEIYRGTPKMKSKGHDVWTKDRELTYRGDIGAGWQIKAEGKSASFDVTSTPEHPVSRYSVAGSAADFNGYISFRTKVSGKITIGRQSVDVDGFGYGLHTFGDMGEHVRWKYVGFRDEKLCITAMNSGFDKDQLSIFVTVDDGMEMNQYKPENVSWKELDQNTWQISATTDEPNSTQIEMTIRLTRPRPTNKNQPYSKYSLAFITISRTNLHEYLAEIQVTVKKAGEQIELKSPGIATKFDLTK